MRRLPWWLYPWREARLMRLAVRQYQHMINDLCETAQTDTATIHRLEAELREAQALIGRLEVDLRASPRPSR